ncbi:MAG: hypothetical protein QNJ70_13070 [Xenococcaceae cyanobacterium MO_207.B15]|nr:hypothetical protein [Xenococcaceae cyanobacterium MO_207.B15]
MLFLLEDFSVSSRVYWCYICQELNTIEALKAEPQMRKFLAWVRKQNPQKRITVHRQK